MRTGLIIAEFETYYCTSFQHTARVKYDVDFNTSNVDALGLKLAELREKIQSNRHKNVHVGFQITIDHVIHVENLLNQILERYKEIFSVFPSNRKIYTINQKLREADAPSPKDVAKDVLREILNPDVKPKQSKSERIKADAEAVSKKRALNLIRKNSAKNK